MPSRQHVTRSFTLLADDPAQANDPDIFAAADVLRYPDAAWWREANPAPKAVHVSRTSPPPPPTRAPYWRDTSLKRLLSPLPLPRESKSHARARVQDARRWIAQLAAYAGVQARAAKPAGGFSEWRIVARGYVESFSPSGPQRTETGYTASPWERITRGERVEDMTIRARVLDVGRHTLQVNPDRSNIRQDGKPTDARHGPSYAPDDGASTLNEQMRGRKYESSVMRLGGKEKKSPGIILEVRRFK